ncbi:mechanosensitive ion channel family protein [Actinotalea sp. K2]|uniref:mechanosensitive ion channel family protein n=1 Tax=Actinotalea sp. K2 TaxID=2939438 RepID=UPI002016C9CD|nr:mechanosensitive ion channel family protein [Actinotalea sp. K2]MCL3860332.1 mechanosensitive ion channel family protein [Actinotalea sp. K2]
MPYLPILTDIRPEVPDIPGEMARGLEWLLGWPLQVAIAVFAGVLLLAVLRWAIARTVRSIVQGGSTMQRTTHGLLRRTRMSRVISQSDPLAVARRVQRAETMGSVMRSSAALVVGLVVLTVVANILDWDLGPLLASAGVAGVALGFGAQTLVKDFLSGLFMLIEDQYGVGDVVNLGEASGVVEAIGLRVTQVRDLSGTLWYVRNGEVLRVGNMTQGWSKALVEVLVPPDQDIDHATRLLRSVATSVEQDPELGPLLLAEADITAYENLSAEAVMLRFMVKVVPAKQWVVQRAVRERIREAFSAEGVQLALPRREVVRERETTAGQDPSSTD